MTKPQEATPKCTAVYKLQAWDSEEGEWVDWNKFVEILEDLNTETKISSEFHFNPETSGLII